MPPSRAACLLSMTFSRPGSELGAETQPRHHHPQRGFDGQIRVRVVEAVGDVVTVYVTTGVGGNGLDRVQVRQVQIDFRVLVPTVSQPDTVEVGSPEGGHDGALIIRNNRIPDLDTRPQVQSG